MVYREELTVATRGRGTYEITRELQRLVERSAVDVGLAAIFLHHTSASLFINENADPDVQRDLEAFLSRLVKDGDPLFVHTAEGDDDMPSHVRTLLTATSLVVPVAGGRLDLGTWQGVFVWEHRRRAHERRVSVTVVG